MGYNIYLCKTNDWSQADEMPISEKWFWSKIKNYKGFRLATEGDQKVAYCLTNANLDLCPILRFNDGAIEIKNPNEQAVKALCKLAKVLGVNLVGDDGEKYITGWFGSVKIVE